MESKEALNQLYIMADTPELAINIQSYYDIVEKDLKVLEILRQYFKYNEKEDLYLIDRTFWKANENYGEGWKKHNEEYFKIKEWLNGKLM